MALKRKTKHQIKMKVLELIVLIFFAALCLSLPTLSLTSFIPLWARDKLTLHIEQLNLY